MSIFARRVCAPFVELAVLHPFEQIEVLVHGAVAVGALAARFVPPPAIGAGLLRTQAADVGLALADQFQRPVVELVEVVRGVERLAAPVETEPAHVALDGLDVLRVFRGRVRVVEAQVAVTAVLLGDAEVEADRLRVADVQVAVRLRREPGDDLAAVLARGDVGAHALADEIEGPGSAGIVGHGGLA